MDIFDRIIAGSISAAIGAFSAYQFTRFNWKKQTKNDSIISMELDFINTIEEFLENCVLYWSEDQINLNDCKILEAKIKMTYMNLDPQFKQLIYLSPNFNIGDSEFITQRIEKLFDHSTGGDFETSRRIASASQCLKIINSCNKIRARVRANIHS